MNLDEIREVLEYEGFSSYQARAYVALLELGDASVTEIVQCCTVPQPRIYDVLRSLDEKGVVETYEDDSLRARVVDPSALIADLESRSSQYAAAAERVDEVWKQPSLDEHDIEIFTEFDQVIDHAVAGIERATESVNVAATGSEFLDLKHALSAAKDDGRIIDLSLHLDSRSQTDISDFEDYFDDATSEVRYRLTPSPFLTLVDAKESYFGVNQRGEGYGMFVKDQALSTMLYGYFQSSLWGRWELVYSDRMATFPKKYTSIRNCVTEIAPHFADGVSLWAAVDGYDTETGEETRVTGEVTDVVPMPSADVSVQESPQVMIVVENGSSAVSVGGFGAIVEDVRARSIRMEVHPQS